MKTLESQLADYGDRQRELHGPITPDELVARGALVSGEGALDSAKWEMSEGRGDDLSIAYLVPREESTPRSEQKRRLGVLTTIAAAIVLVVGVVVVADGDNPEVSTGPGSSPPAADPLALSKELTRLPHDAVFGGDGGPGMRSVTVGGPGLVAVGGSNPGGSTDGDAVVWTSVDGISWSRVPDDEAVFGGEGNQSMSSVIAGGPGLVAVGPVLVDGWDDTDAAVWTSVDGISWSRVPHDEAIFGGARMFSVTVGGPGLVAVGSIGVGDSAADRDAAVWTSEDGLTWSQVPHDEAVFGGANNQEMMDITAGGPGLVAVGTDGEGIIDNSRSQIAAVWTSVDGITWSRVPPEAVSGRSGNYPMWSVTAGGPGLVSVGWDGPDAAVWTSVDGLTWSQVPYDEAVFGATGEWEMVSVSAVGPGLVAVGDAVWASMDGRTWSLTDNPTDSGATMWSVTAAGPGLVSVGDAGLAAAVWVAATKD